MTNKEIILQTALQLFGEKGYDRTPTSQIAKQAMVSEGLIFRHFGNKAGLLNALIQEGLAQISNTMAAYVDDSSDPRSAICLHIDRSLTMIREQEKFWQLATKIRFQTEVSQIAGTQLEQVNQFIMKHLVQNFQKLQVKNPEEEALILFALIDGICLHWLQAPDSYPLDSMKNLLLNKYERMDFGSSF